MRHFAFNLFSLALVAFPAAAQIYVEDLPTCWALCVDATSSCGDLEVDCMCEASYSSFLPDLVTCVRVNCESLLDFDILINPLQYWCLILGIQIPISALFAAEDAATAAIGSFIDSFTAEPTPTDTDFFDFPSTSIDFGFTDVETTRTVEAETSSEQTRTRPTPSRLTHAFATTITKTTTNSDGETIYVINPITIGPNTAIYGRPSTITPTELVTLVPDTTGSEIPIETAENTSSAPTATSDSSDGGNNNNGSPFDAASGINARDSWILSVLAFVFGLAWI
ncbi:hypothetical protein M501DRAFT_406133 [Patellaria atrata CBS 101060]|uniref:Extracellular membrane protein CFEM domain-containing protein n=1 Tax=Patellaria atrata CBS 101060 TaxID=1346257 RepID=A0A9P4SHB9_9PEZI|nr:hypothetical protein M501DRAFT_406133 [Patellaria atrata CBS 101060]